MAIVRKTVQIGGLPSREAMKEVEEAAKKEIVYGEESPLEETWIQPDSGSALDKHYKPQRNRLPSN